MTDLTPEEQSYGRSVVKQPPPPDDEPDMWTPHVQQTVKKVAHPQTPEEFGQNMGGIIGRKIFKRMDFYVKEHKSIALIGPKGFGKGRMVLEFAKHFYPNDFEVATDAKAASVFGTGTAKGTTQVKIQTPIILKKFITIFPDFSAMLDKHDIQEFKAKTNEALEYPHHVKLYRAKFTSTPDVNTAVLMEKYHFNFNPTEGFIEYDYKGVWIICLLDDFWEKDVPDDMKERFMPICVSMIEAEQVFFHLLEHGFLPESNLPDLAPFKFLIERLFPESLRTARHLVELAEHMRQLMLDRHAVTPSKFDLLNALFFIRDELAYKRGGEQKDLTIRIIQEFLPTVDLFTIATCLEMDVKTLQNLMGEQPDFFTALTIHTEDDTAEEAAANETPEADPE